MSPQRHRKLPPDKTTGPDTAGQALKSLMAGQTQASVADPEQGDAWIAVGVVRGAFGVHGALKIEAYNSADQTVLNQVTRWRMVGHRETDSAAARLLPFPLPADVTVASLKQHGGQVVATLIPGISREQALALKGAEVLVQRKDFPAPEPDEYYWTDLIGSQVVDPGGKPLGVVEAMDDHGAQSVLRLDNGILIPFVAAFILEVVPQERRIVADWSADWV